MNTFSYSIRLLLVSTLVTLIVIATFIPANADGSDNSKAVDVGELYSVSDKKGRFHRIHTKELQLDCEQCHGGDQYKPDYLLVSKHSDWVKRKMGRVERSVCLGCHITGGMGNAF